MSGLAGVSLARFRERFRVSRMPRPGIQATMAKAIDWYYHRKG